MRLLTHLLLLSVVVAWEAPAQSQTQGQPCAVSQLVRDSAPSDSAADPVNSVNWYINSDRTIWAGPVPDGGWPSGGTLYSGGGRVNGQKTYWVRPQGTQLSITGRRIDAAAPPVEAHIPCCYGTGFQIVALWFPTAGCWEVSATAGERELKFVTRVKASDVVETTQPAAAYVRLEPEQETTLHVGDAAVVDFDANAPYGIGAGSGSLVRSEELTRTDGGKTHVYRAARVGRDTLVATPEGLPPGHCISCVTRHYFINVVP